jgi:hypothetical protein
MNLADQDDSRGSRVCIGGFRNFWKHAIIITGSETPHGDSYNLRDGYLKCPAQVTTITTCQAGHSSRYDPWSRLKHAQEALYGLQAPYSIWSQNECQSCDRYQLDRLLLPDPTYIACGGTNFHYQLNMSSIKSGSRRQEEESGDGRISSRADTVSPSASSKIIKLTSQ